MNWIRLLPVLTLLISSTALAAGNKNVTELLIGLFWVVLAATVFGAIASRIGVPAVVGQVLAGIVIGPNILGLVQPEDFFITLAELGAIFLLFMVGLETRFKDLLKVGKEAIIVAILGIAIPLALGYGFGIWQNYNMLTSLFIGTALVATSVGITAKVLQEMGMLSNRFAQIILGAAVIDDILGLTILAVVSGLGKGEAFELTQVLITLGISIGFVILVLLVGIPFIRRSEKRLKNISLHNAFNTALIAGLGLAALSAVAGLAPIIGAFLAGMVLAEVKENVEFETKVHAIEAFLAPIFFVVVGLQLDLNALGSPKVIVAGLVLTVLAIIGKIIGGLIGANSLGKSKALLVGIGMVPRGEVGLIVASLGVAIGLINKTVYAEVLLMVMLTTIAAPLVMRILAKQGIEKGDLIAKDS